MATSNIWKFFEKVENQTQDFLKKIESVETGISSQINYLSQVGIGAPHDIRDRQATVDRVAYLCGVVSLVPSTQNPGSSTFL
uniref:Uncharacterized protein n=1 Tax=Romanomermis culicivorax TaxID=13658 RepID=A0A915HRK1_ROMCU